jgi:acyl carrier protein
LSIKENLSKVLRVFGQKSDRLPNSVESSSGKTRSDNVNIDVVFEKVQEVLNRLVDKSMLNRQNITMDSYLVEDLGFTSLNFVELTLALERALDIRIFPIQEWIDDEMTRESHRFTVRSLVSKCVELIAEQS